MLTLAEWAEWSSCSVSCGEGQRSRLRVCSDGPGGSVGCVGEANQAELCNNGMCVSGKNTVVDTAQGSCCLIIHALSFIRY